MTRPAALNRDGRADPPRISGAQAGSKPAPAPTSLRADTVSRAERAPAVLLPYQQAWCADRTQVKVMEKSRRVGLTWGEAADCVTSAASVNGEDCWYIGYTKDMAEEFILDCADWAKQLNEVVSEIEAYEETFFAGEERKSIQAYRIRFASGFRISALSSSPRNLRGKQGRVILDEAAFHDALRELLKAALALLMWGGRVHIISTHDGAENPFSELVQEIRAGKLPYSLHRVTLDDALNQGLYRRICLKAKQQWSAEGEAVWRAGIYAFYGDNAGEELDCVPAKGGGVWLPRALIEARMVDVPVVRWTAPERMDLWPDHLIQAEVASFCERELLPLLLKLDPERPSYFGEDFGRHADLSVYVPMQLTRSLKRCVPFTVELSNAPFVAQKMILIYLLDRLPRFSYGKLDAGGNGSFLAEEARRRYGEGRIEPVLFTESWYRDNTAPMKAAFEDDLIEVPRDADTLDDLAAFRLIKGTPRLPDLRTTGKSGTRRHGDAGIAILLAYSASRMDPYQPYDYEAVRPGKPDRDREDDGRDLRVTGGFNTRTGAW